MGLKNEISRAILAKPALFRTGSTFFMTRFNDLLTITFRTVH